LINDHDYSGEVSDAMASTEHSTASQLLCDDLKVELKRPKRITITVSDSLYRKLVERSDREGRSLSNLASYLLQRDLEGHP
jgi:hypothetical protein